MSNQLLLEMGRLVRSLRKEREWTRRELAAKTGISERFLADVETGKANPSVLKLCELAKALGTTPSTLLAESGSAAPRIIALLGLRGAGKSTVGHALAERLDWRFVELDAEIETFTGLALAQIFELNGEAYFRRAERDVLQRLIDDVDTPCVVATGGGLVTERQTFELLRANALTVWLEARPEDHWGRVVAQGDTRPMANHDEAFGALCAILEDRRRLYEQADFTIDTSDRDVTWIAEEIEGELQRRR